MSESRFDIRKIAGLAKLKLTEEEEVRFSGQFSEILSYMNIISETDTSGIEENEWYDAPPKPLRKDIALPSLERSQIFMNAPAHENGFFITPKVKD